MRRLTRTDRGRRGAATVVAVALAAVVVAGCSAGDDAGDAAFEDAAGEASAPADAGMADDAVDAGVDEEAAAEEGAAEEEAPATDDGAGGGAVLTGDTAGRDVIREATVVLTSDDPDATVAAVTRAAESAGGFVAGTDLQRTDGLLAGTVTLRVPASGLGGTLDAIAEAGAEVVEQRLDARDVTGQVSDVEAQLRNLRALEGEMLELLDAARAEGGTERVLGVFDRIRSVRGEIEQLEGRQATLADLVALATVTVRVEPTDALLARSEPVPTPPELAPWTPGSRLASAWAATLGALRTTADVAIVLLVTVLPLLLAWAVPFVILWAVVRAVRRRRAVSFPPPAPRATQPDAGASVPSTPNDRE